MVGLQFFIQKSYRQSAGDSLALLINTDSGIVNIDTNVVIHNSSLTVEGGNATTSGQFKIDVAAFNNDLQPGTKTGDVLVSARRGDGTPPSSSTDLWNCAEIPGIRTSAFFHEFDLSPCPSDFNDVLKVLRIDEDGVTINTTYTSPPPSTAYTWQGAKTTINGDLLVNGQASFSQPLLLTTSQTWTTNGWHLPLSIDDAHALKFNGGATNYGLGSTSSTGNFYLFSTTTNGTSAAADYRLIMSPDGDFGINTAPNNQYKLSVNGDIRAKKVRVETGWSDFVFDKNYALPKLSDVENYIATHHHLPEIPSAAEVEKNGVELGTMQSKLLQKVEELTLYVIQQQKEMEELKKQNAEMLKAIANKH